MGRSRLLSLINKYKLRMAALGVAGVTTLAAWQAISDPCFSFSNLASMSMARRGPTCEPDDPEPPEPSTWAMEVIKAPEGVGSDFQGADGVDVADIDGDGDLDVVTPWEQSSKVVVCLQPADPVDAWQCVIVGGNNSVETAIFADVDGDGAIDVISGGEDKDIKVHYAPLDPGDILTAAEWDTVHIVDADLNPWSVLAWADVDGDAQEDIILGGKEGAGAAEIQWLLAPVDPRVGTGWTVNTVDAVGWTMTLEPLDVDGDTDIDLVVADRTGADAGSRWLENTAGDGSTWANHQISTPSCGQPKFLHIVDWDGDTFLDVIEGASNAGCSFIRIQYGDGSWTAWTPESVPVPSGVGRVHDVATGDMDEDGDLDMVLSFSNADDNLIGLVWLNGDTWASTDISGVDGTKYDNVILFDPDEDNDLDVIIAEGGDLSPSDDDLGTVWYVNPAVP